MIEIKQPNIMAASDHEMMVQMRSYLYQMAGQLQWAFDTMQGSSGQSSQAQNQQAQQKTGYSGGETIDPVATFNSMKNLIIKSADIVNAYYDQINKKLEGVYVAQGDFGNYTEQTSQEIQENSTNINQAFSNIQNLSSSLEAATQSMASIEKILVGVNAYVNSGLLYYDDTGIPVYGIEVGQRTEVNGEEVFDKYARFTANRLSFFDANGNEVAYISDYKLFISNVEVTGSYRIGHLVDTVQSDGSIVTKYTGG